MKKTLTANIGGAVFHIEEDAYEQLQRYLISIRTQFAGSEGRDEIMADIESRIAELFTERLDGRRAVVTLDDVGHVMRTMGQPEDYVTGAEEPGPERSESRSSGGGQAYSSGKRRLFRDPDDKWVGGVLGGVAAYFNIDPLILRLVYLVFLFMGFGFLLYLILWIVVPKAETAADRLSMRGEPVNVENIKRVVEEGAERFEKGARTMADEAQQMGRDMGPRVQRAGSEVGRFLTEAFQLFILALGKFIGLILLIAGAAVAVALLVMLFGQYSFMLSGTGLGDGPDLQQWALLLFDSPSQLNWTWLALIAFLLVPVIGLLYGGISLLFGVKAPRWFGLAMAPVWIVAIAALTYIGIQLGTQFRVEEYAKDEAPIAQPTQQTVVLKGMDLPEGKGYRNGYRRDLDHLRLEDGTVQLAWADLDVRPSADTLYHLVVERKARASGHKDASRRAQGIRYTVQQTADSVITLAPWIAFDATDRFRGQQVHFILEVPLGRAVFFDASVEQLMNDIDNVTDTWDRDMVGRTWTMTPNGLSDRVRPGDVPDDLRPAPRATAPTVISSIHEPRTYQMPDLWAVLRPQIRG